LRESDEATNGATEEVAARLERKRQKAYRVTDKAVEKRRHLFRKSDEAIERATNKAGDKTASSLERKQQSGFFR
jgi:hypothetical protein